MPTQTAPNPPAPPCGPVEIQDVVAALRQLLESCPSDDDLFLLMYSANSHAMSDLSSKTGQAHHAMCDRLRDATEHARQILALAEQPY